MPGEAPKEAVKDAPKGKGHTAPKSKLKLWIRYLPPGLTDEQLRETVDGLAPDAMASLDWCRVVPATKQVPTVTAYLHFKTEDALQTVHIKLDGHKLSDAKGKEYKVLSEYAPYQKIPRKKVIDRREGTIDKDPDFVAFMEDFEQQRSFKIESAEAWLERREQDAAAKAAAAEGAEKTAALVSTPLLDFVREKLERNMREKRDRKNRDDDRRRKMQEDPRQRVTTARGGSSGSATARGGGRSGRGGSSSGQTASNSDTSGRPASSLTRPSSAGSSQSSRSADSRGSQAAAAASGKQDAQQAQQGKGGGRDKQAPKQASQTKSNPLGAGKQIQVQQIQQREAGQAAPPAAGQTQRPSGAGGGDAAPRPAPAARGGRGGGRGGGVQVGGGGGGSGGGVEGGSAGGRGGGGGAAGATGGGGVSAGREKGKAARPVGVYRPRGRGESKP